MKKLFRESVLAVVRNIPKGNVLSYGEVAARAGYPRAARAVGSLMRRNHDDTVPCHRVICCDGRPGEYNGLVGEKETLLKKEGVSIIHGRVIK